MSGVDQKAAEVVAAANRAKKTTPTQQDLDRLCGAIDAVSGVVDRSDRITAELVPMLARFEESARDPIIDDLMERFRWAKVSLRRDAAKAAAALKPQEKPQDRASRSPDPEAVPGTYLVRDNQLRFVVASRHGPELLPVTNFTAWIAEQVYGDDGSDEPVVTYHVEGRLYDGRPLPPLIISNRQFDSMSWVNDWGGEPVVLAGPGMRDHARVGIKKCSPAPLPTRHRYRHIGWRLIGDRWVYLHAAGAIGSEGSVPGVEVELSGAFRQYVLPEPPQGDRLADAVVASLQILNVAPLEVVVPIYAAMTRAPLGSIDFSLFIAGDSGFGKSELAALAQRHWGVAFHGKNLPGSWASTANSLEVAAFVPKDALFVIDDFAPTGGRNDFERMMKDADRFFRAVGNQAGRGRLGPNRQMEATKCPRCLPLSTGEDIPRGLASMVARVFWLEMGPEDMRWTVLTDCQADAAAGLYAEAMAGYVQWLAVHHAEVFTTLEHQRNVVAASLAETCRHKRTPRIVADLLVGLKTWLRYAADVGAIPLDQVEPIYTCCSAALVEVAKRQGKQQANRDVSRRFLDLVRSAIVSGRAHIATPDGRPPIGIETAMGWRRAPREEWVPQGARVGWLDERGFLWLHRDASYSVAQEQGRQQGDGLSVTNTTLAKRMKEAGLLAAVDASQDSLFTRRTFEGTQHKVYCLHAVTFLSEMPDTTYERPDQDQNSSKPSLTLHGKLSINLNSFRRNEGNEGKSTRHTPSHDAGAGTHDARTDHAHVIADAQASRPLPPGAFPLISHISDVTERNDNDKAMRDRENKTLIVRVSEPDDLPDSEDDLPTEPVRASVSGGLEAAPKAVPPIEDDLP